MKPIQNINTAGPYTYTVARKKNEPSETVAVIGVGYVGLPLALRAATQGYDVVGFDIDEAKIASLKKKRASHLSPAEAEELESLAISFSNDPRTLEGRSLYIICVPTPVHENHAPDLGPLEAACKTVGTHLSKGALVAVESTVNPGVCEEVAIPILERASGLSAGTDFSFVHCPERINPGDETWSVRNIPRCIGGIDRESLERGMRFYGTITDGELVPMQTLKETEAVKMVENAFRDINIAFVNELAMSFDRADIDLTNVIRAASSKPFGFLAHMPGCGVGGHCIPVDPYYLIRYGKRNGFEHRFLKMARDINTGMPKYAVKQLAEMLRAKRRSLSGTTIALLGLSYKRDIPDMRESPALDIRDALLAKGASVRTFDPLTPEHSTALSLEDALHGADAAVIATDHSAFRALEPSDFLKAGVRYVLDGRNCLSKQSFVENGITYRGIGR